MKAKMIWANFSVQDAERTRRFYTQLGFTPNKGHYPRLASFLFGDGGFVIHFFEQGSQIDAFLPPGSPAGEVIFTLSAETEAEVDGWKVKVQAAGGTILNDPGKDGTGHYGFVFADPDGHRFNVLLIGEGM